MKKTLIAFAALTAIAGIAQAQSTVTIYGLVDANIKSFKSNVAVGTGAGATIQQVTQTGIDSGGLNGSRWGIRVNEDLGGGLAAVANLESGFSIDSGSQATSVLGTGPSAGTPALFNRRANVGVTSSAFGTVTLGRNSTSYDDVSADHAMMGSTLFDPSYQFANAINPTSAVAASTTAGIANLISRPAAWVGYNQRFNNSIKYISPNFSGFSGSATYGFGEDKTTSVGASKSVSANLKYANGPLVVSGGYQSEGFARTGDAKPALENTLLSVAYDLGVAKIGAGFNRSKLKDVTVPTNLGGNGTATFAAQKEYSLSVAVPLGATTLSAGYAQSKGDTLGKSSGFGVQALYSLSKRTTLYAGAQNIKAYSNVVAAAPVNSNVGRSMLYAAGVRHTF